MKDVMFKFSRQLVYQWLLLAVLILFGLTSWLMADLAVAHADTHPAHKIQLTSYLALSPDGQQLTIKNIVDIDAQHQADFSLMEAGQGNYALDLRHFRYKKIPHQNINCDDSRFYQPATFQAAYPALWVTQADDYSSKAGRLTSDPDNPLKLFSTWSDALESLNTIDKNQILAKFKAGGGLDFGFCTQISSSSEPPQILKTLEVDEASTSLNLSHSDRGLADTPPHTLTDTGAFDDSGNNLALGIFLLVLGGVVIAVLRILGIKTYQDLN